MLAVLLCLVALAAPEIPYDGLDQDGDGVDLVDADGDGWASVLAFGRDCNDRDAGVHPGAVDPDGDGLDGDCDGKDGVVVPPPPRRGCLGGASWLLAVWGVVALCGVRRQGTSMRRNSAQESTSEPRPMTSSDTKPCHAHGVIAS